jgi:hypothetical protein
LGIGIYAKVFAQQKLEQRLGIGFEAKVFLEKLLHGIVHKNFRRDWKLG